MTLQDTSCQTPLTALQQVAHGMVELVWQKR